MSSNEDDSLSQGLKKRRIQRACDICRRKKIRCDGVHMPGNRCSSCVSYSLDCTYVEASKKRGPPKGYVESLENRVEKLDKLLRKLVPDTILFKELHDSIDKQRVSSNPSPLVATQQPTFPHASPTISIDTLSSTIPGITDNVTTSVDGVHDDSSILADNLKRLALSPSKYRFFGKSSGPVLFQAAMELKQEYTQSEEPVHIASQNPRFSALRTEFWAPHEWELGSNLVVQSPHYTFPEDDFALDLIDFYFSNINLYLPLLHRPSFQKSVTEGLHRIDERFASIYLLVCAIGARYSDDRRVLLDGVDSLHSCGWRWFNQVQMVKTSFLCPPTLYDLQFYCLSVLFLQGSSSPQSCWTMVGFGIRLAQDVGVHRRKVHQHIATAKDEQWKRAFWVLVCLDRLFSAAMGRPCAIHDDDFDLELPVDCDDEYWDHPDPKQRFKQPENKPSLISAFILFIKLNQILSYCLRTIYAINKSKILFGYAGHNWEQHIVAELDSALNKWVDSVPDHLRWDPTREDEDSFNQSASCYALYYHIQILIHRPFIPSPTKPSPASPLAFPSLAICTNAARSCSHVAEIQRRRTRFPPVHCNMAVFTSGIVLLLSIWGGRRSGLSIDFNREMTDVHNCMKTLKFAEKRWCTIGRLWDILNELAKLPLSQASPMSMSTNKREWDCDTPRSVSSSESPQSMIQDDGPRFIAGSRRVNKDSGQSMRTGQSQHQPNQQQRHPPQLPTSSMATTSRPPTQHADRSMTSVPSNALPVYSDELGRLPLQDVDFSTQAYLDQANGWYQSIPNESSPDSDHISPQNSQSHHSNRRQHQQVPDHHHVQSSHNTINYSNEMTEASTIAQGFSLDPSIGTGHMPRMFDPVPLTYIPPTTYAGVSPSIDIGRPSHSSFRGISMTLRGDHGGSVLDQRQESSQPPSHLEKPQHQHYHQHQHHTQGQREHDVHGNREQQQQHTMGYSYLDKDTMAMWQSAPTGFELDEWSTYLSNMSELTQGAHSGGQIHVLQQ